MIAWQKSARRIVDQVELQLCIEFAIAQGIEHLKSVNGLIEDPIAPLTVGFFSFVVRKGRHHMHPLFRKKLGEFSIGFIGTKNGEVGSHDQVLNAALLGFLDKPTEVGMHFRGSPSQVESVHVSLFQNGQTFL